MNLVDNNKIEQVADLVTGTLVKLPEEVKSRLASIEASTRESLAEKPGDRFDAERSMEDIQHLVVSDTIILMLDFDADFSPGDELWCWFLLLSYVSLLLRSGFDAGLPMRGAVGMGEYYVHERTFAGRPMVDAFRTAQSLQFSGCVIQEETGTHLATLWETHAPEFGLGDLIYRYLAPVSGERDKRLFVVDWLTPFKDWGSEPPDVRRYVIESFQAHNKDVAGSVLDKLNNTEIMLRFALARAKKE